MPIMLGVDKKKISDGLIEGIIGGKKAYSTMPSLYPESAKMCAMEFLKAVESKDPNKVIAAFIALDHEVDAISPEEPEEEEEGTEIEIKL
jgi:hypothetical protein